MKAFAQSSEAGTLWRVSAYGRQQQVEAHSGFWFENAGRAPVGAVVVQYTRSGRIVLREGAQLRDVPPRHAALFSYGEDSGYGLSRDCRERYICEWLVLSGAGLFEHVRVLRQRHGSVVPFTREVLAGFRQLMVLAGPRSAVSDPVAMAAAVHTWLMALFAALRQDQLLSQSPVEQAIEALLRSPTHPWSLKQLAEQFGCSREHLTRVFCRRMQAAPGAWLAQARLAKALQLLRSTNLSVATIAEQAGFSSAHTLARQVRQHTGKSPRAARPFSLRKKAEGSDTERGMSGSA